MSVLPATQAKARFFIRVVRLSRGQYSYEPFRVISASHGVSVSLRFAARGNPPARRSFGEGSGLLLRF